MQGVGSGHDLFERVALAGLAIRANAPACGVLAGQVQIPPPLFLQFRLHFLFAACAEAGQFIQYQFVDDIKNRHLAGGANLDDAQGHLDGFERRFRSVDRHQNVAE